MLRHRMLNRRINYAYLARLEDRLTELGHTITEWDDELIEQTWPAHRDYMKDTLQLDYCVRCHLPIPHEDVAEGFKDMCNAHAEGAKQAIETRRHRAQAHYISKLSKRPNLDRIDPRVAGVVARAEHDHNNTLELPAELIQAARARFANEDPESQPIIKAPASPMDILNRANKRDTK